mmetsp:Transcript_28461/g.71411  ORF Transcript_28461/g.71411 Transcript_28461/m.71411 type:complete len:215 (+) Transcript_28461:359-1003(+)
MPSAPTRCAMLPRVPAQMRAHRTFSSSPWVLSDAGVLSALPPPPPKKPWRYRANCSCSRSRDTRRSAPSEMKKRDAGSFPLSRSISLEPSQSSYTFTSASTSLVPLSEFCTTVIVSGLVGSAERKSCVERHAAMVIAASTAFKRTPRMSILPTTGSTGSLARCNPSADIDSSCTPPSSLRSIASIVSSCSTARATRDASGGSISLAINPLDGIL